MTYRVYSIILLSKLNNKDVIPAVLKPESGPCKKAQVFRQTDLEHDELFFYKVTY